MSPSAPAPSPDPWHALVTPCVPRRSSSLHEYNPVLLPASMYAVTSVSWCGGSLAPTVVVTVGPPPPPFVTFVDCPALLPPRWDVGCGSAVVHYAAGGSIAYATCAACRLVARCVAVTGLYVCGGCLAALGRRLAM